MTTIAHIDGLADYAVIGVAAVIPIITAWAVWRSWRTAWQKEQEE